MSILQRVNDATPLLAATGLVHPENTAPPVPVAGLIPKVTLLPSVVTVLPPASSTATTGWVVNAVPPAAPDGGVVNPSFAAEPTLMVKVVLSTVSVPSLACSLYAVPDALSIAQPVKPATPDDCVSGLPSQVRAPAGSPVPPLMLSVIERCSVVTTLLLVSSIATAGCVDSAVPPVPLLGWWKKTSFTPPVGVTVKASLSAGCSPVDEAVNV